MVFVKKLCLKKLKFVELAEPRPGEQTAALISNPRFSAILLSSYFDIVSEQIDSQLLLRQGPIWARGPRIGGDAIRKLSIGHHGGRFGGEWATLVFSVANSQII